MKRSRLARKTPLKAHRVSKRFAAERVPAYLAWIKTLPCVIGHGCGGVIDPHHVRGRKVNDVGTVVSLCRVHHEEFHAHGRHTFDRKYGVCLVDEAQWLATQYEEER